MNASADAIDTLLGASAAARVAGLRAERAQARDNAQASYMALFAPSDVADMALAERRAIAVFVALLHDEASVAAFYGDGVDPAVAAEAGRAMAPGPYGRYPEGPLSAEDRDGPTYSVAPAHRAALGARLSAGLEHAHMLVLHPRDAAPAALRRLLDAGWTTTGIVTLSQLVSFLAFQIRVVGGLRVLAAAMGEA